MLRAPETDVEEVPEENPLLPPVPASEPNPGLSAEPSVSLRDVGAGPSWRNDAPAVEQETKCTLASHVDGNTSTDLTQGIIATVHPWNTDEINRLRGLVDTRLHRAVEAEDLAAIKSLVKAGASLEALDPAGRTPLHLCIHRKLLEPLELLLSYEDSVHVRDASGLPLMHVALLHEWQEGARAALAAGADLTAISTRSQWWPVNFTRYPRVGPPHSNLFHLAHTPIHLAVETNATDILEDILTVAVCNDDVDCLNGYGQTALYTAIKNGNLAAVKILVRSGASVNRISNKMETALHIAVEHPNILKYLLDNTDATSSFDHEGLAPIHYAVIYEKPESVKLLLKKFKEAKLRNTAGKTALHMAATCTSTDTAKAILVEDVSTVDEKDDDGDTPLHAAAYEGNKALMLMLLNCGADLSMKGKGYRTVLEVIATTFIDSLDVFELIFNEYIYTHDNQVHVDYTVLTKGTDMNQIDVINEFITYGQSKTLQHPFMMSLLYLKMKHFFPVFFIIVAVYVSFLLTFNIFVVNVFYNADIKDNTNTWQSGETAIFVKFNPDTNMTFSLPIKWQIRNFAMDLTTSSTNSSEARGPGVLEHEQYGGWQWLMIVWIYISITALIVQECLYIYFKRSSRAFYPGLESLARLCTLVLGAIIPAAMSVAEPAAWLRHAACAALLLGWLHLMFLMARFPIWGHYIPMFCKVAAELLKVFAMVAFLLVLTFSCCFMIQYGSAPPFDGPFAAFVKTLVMMSSEFDYENLFGEDHSELQDRRTVVRLMFVVFVVFGALVLMNFMIGVAVSDIHELTVIGNTRRLEKQVELLSTLECLVYDGIYGVLAKKFKIFSDGRFHKKMVILDNRSVISYIQKNCLTESVMYDTKAFIQFYPHTYFIEIHKALLDITSGENHSKNTYIDKIDVLYDTVVGRPVHTISELKKSKMEIKNSTSLREMILKQNELMKSLADQLLQVRNVNDELKRSYVDLNSKMSQMTSNIAMIKEML